MTYRRVLQTVVDWSPADVDADEAPALMAVKAGTRLLFASAEILIAAAASTNSTAEVGLVGGDVDGFITSASGSGNLDLEAGTVGAIVQGTGALLLASGGHLFTADDTIDLTYTNGTQGAVTPKVRFRFYTIRER